MKKLGLLAMVLSLSMLVMGCAEDKSKKTGGDKGGKTGTEMKDKGGTHEGAEGTTGKPAETPKK